MQDGWAGSGPSEEGGQLGPRVGERAAGLGGGVAQGPWLLRGASLGPGSVVVML